MSNHLYADLAWLPQPPEDFLSGCHEALEAEENLGTRLRSLASYRLDQNRLSRVAKIVSRAYQLGNRMDPLTGFRLGILSNSTADFIELALAGTAPRHGIALSIARGAYDQIVQSAVSPDSEINRAQPDAVLLAIDYHGLPCATAGDEKLAVEACLDFLKSIRNGIKRNCGAICIFQTVAAPPETLFGSLDIAISHSQLRIINELNPQIVGMAAGTEDVILDVAHLANTVGLADWHSPKEWNLARIPFSSALLPLYAEHVCRIIAALRGKSRRCLVLDLDNTIWGGVVGDDGLEGIQIARGDPTGEAHLSLQRLALELRRRGIVLAICSKNEDEIARLPFREHPEMLLREEHIAAFQANWSDKATNLKAISDGLCLGLESIVFLDDNPVERAFVRQVLPEVAVPELPEDPALYVRTLTAAGYFEAVTFSEEDFRRADFYQRDARHVRLQEQTGELESYLRSLDMEIVFKPFDEAGRARIAQLINKSNQFNLTTRRYTAAQVAMVERDPSYFTLQVRLSDAFGENGMISVVICHDRSDGAWIVDTWLMSCRVLGRRVENMVLKNMVDHARKRGIRKLIGVYIPTDRNKLVENHYGKLGFTEIGREEDGTKTYELNVESAIVEEAPMRMRCVCCTAS